MPVGKPSIARACDARYVGDPAWDVDDATYDDERAFGDLPSSVITESLATEAPTQTVEAREAS